MCTEIDIDTNARHILKSCSHLTEWTRLDTIRHADWIGDLGRVTDDCFIFDLVINNGLTRLFDSKSSGFTPCEKRMR